MKLMLSTLQSANRTAITQCFMDWIQSSDGFMTQYLSGIKINIYRS